MATARNNQAAKGAAAANSAKAQAGETRQVLQVIAKRDGFRRAGREWHGTSTIAVDELTKEQYEQLTSEPMLVTLLLEVPADQVDEIASAEGDAGGATGT